MGRTTSCERCLSAYEAWMGACPHCAPEAGRAAPDWDAVRARMDVGRGDAARTYCPHCARLYAADAAHCPRCPPLEVEQTKGGTCPRCAGAMAPLEVGPVAADRCGACGGTWFDRGELERAIDLTAEGDAPKGWRRSLPAWAKPPEAVRYVPCVRCGERMARRLAAPLSGVVVDLCRRHGLWLDAGELEHLEAFAAAHGLQAVRDAEEAPPPRTPPWAPPWTDVDVHGFARRRAGWTAGMLALRLLF